MLFPTGSIRCVLHFHGVSTPRVADSGRGRGQVRKGEVSSLLTGPQRQQGRRKRLGGGGFHYIFLYLQIFFISTEEAWAEPFLYSIFIPKASGKEGSVYWFGSVVQVKGAGVDFLNSF